MPEIGLQLYTLRELMEQDFIGTLKKVAKIGYQAVEFHHFGGMTAKELRGVVDDLGLKPLSSHVALDRLEHELEQVISESVELGLEYVVCPWLPESRRETPEAIASLASVLEKIGARCQEAGLQFAYHNHDFEFAKVGDEFALDVLFANTSANHVQAELDLYWIKRAGQDPVAYIQKYKNRCDLLHVKDMSAKDGSFDTVGQGVLPWPDIFAAAEQAGAKWYIVEQDVCPGDPLESIQTSLQFLLQQR
ncbi:sugar phosphate isomerase/epimerase family protein [Alicyclobacillus fodiniaquatilis]|uniref:Sugar phosphate isomerase/epimerase family protein n=1 Tax=Alicyclobacillus fodiniaquatilis TaxID=1661150 RepID=A0ABW4JMZ3_9BACL